MGISLNQEDLKMKLFLVLFAQIFAQEGQLSAGENYANLESTTLPILSTSAADTGVSCFHCDAKNMTHCRDIGEMKMCPENSLSCMVEVRKRDGDLESICMGCKAPEACADNKAQNFVGPWSQR